MATTKYGGYGREAYGDPFGAGGPLYVVRARAVESQTVRVCFDELPINLSPTSADDALNPTNYRIAIVSGTGTAPQVIAVKPTMIYPPATGVEGGDEVGVDVQVDKPLVDALIYRVTAQRILSSFGGALGSPYSATFPGCVSLAKVPAPTHVAGNVDLFNDFFSGQPLVDGSGDLAMQDALSGLKKRIYRRLITSKNAYSHLPGYGVIPLLKNALSPRNLGLLRSDILDQVKQEPEVNKASVALSSTGNGVLTISVKVQTKASSNMELGLTVSASGISFS